MGHKLGLSYHCPAVPLGGLTELRPGGDTAEYRERWSDTPCTPGLCKYRLSLPQDHVLAAFASFGRAHLSDAAGLPAGHARLPNVVQQARLAVVNVSHDCHDGRARQQVIDVVLRHKLRLCGGAAKQGPGKGCGERKCVEGGEGTDTSCAAQGEQHTSSSISSPTTDSVCVGVAKKARERVWGECGGGGVVRGGGGRQGVAMW
eukprot:364427-Chlamydomonas_euryale.AAC.3